MKNNSVKLFAVLIFLISLWILAALLRETSVWYITVNLIAIYIIAKYKSFDKTHIVIGALLGIMCMPSSIVMGVSAILPYIAAMAIFENSTNRLWIYKDKKPHTLISTIILIFVVGGILGGINVFFAAGSMPINLSFELRWVTDALRAGIFEEIFFRFFFFAICVYITHDQPLSKLQNVLCYAIMVIPHVLIHFNFQTISVVNMIMLSLLFGLPFAWMQRKRNLVSAMGSHAFVDFIRFCTFGL